MGSVPTSEDTQVPIDTVASNTSCDEAHTLEELEVELMLFDAFDIVGGRGECEHLVDCIGLVSSVIDVRDVPFYARAQLVCLAKSMREAVAEMEAPADFERPIILSGKHTFETQTKHVLAGLAKAR